MLDKHFGRLYEESRPENWVAKIELLQVQKTKS
jgi:hypothetical protein